MQEFIVYSALNYICYFLESDECFQIYPVSLKTENFAIIILFFNRWHWERPIKQERGEYKINLKREKKPLNFDLLKKSKWNQNWDVFFLSCQVWLKQLLILSVGEGMGKQALSFISGGNVNWPKWFRK